MSRADEVINTLRKAFNISSNILAVPAAVSLVLLVLLITAYIIGNRFGVHWLFVEEITEFWLVSFGYLSFTYALVKGRHVICNFAIVRLPLKAKRVLRVVTTYLAILATSYLTWRAIEWFIKEWTRKTVTATFMQIPFWPFSLIVVIGLTAFLIGLLLELALSIVAAIYNKDLQIQHDKLASQEELEGTR